MRESRRYCAFGLRIESELELPELGPFADSADVPADVTIRREILTVPDVAQKGPLRIDGRDVYLSVDRTASFRVREGREIAFDPHAGASERNVRLFLLGSAFGLLCHQRGLLPLHANAVVADGVAVAFSGRTGIGKSTLAAHFQSRGYELLCDDVCVISFDADGQPLAWPGLPRLKLWRDAAEMFGHDSSGLERALDGMEKFHVPMTSRAPRGPFPLARVYILRNQTEGEPVMPERLAGKAALQAIMVNTYRRNFLSALGLTKQNFFHAASVARRAEVYAAPRRRGFEIFGEEALRFERHFSGARSGFEASAAAAAENVGA